MKVLFIGPYRQMDGWGEAARAAIFSLLTVKDIDVYLRHITLANMPQVDIQILNNLESRNIDGEPDVVIQNALPEYFINYKGVRNIGMFMSETRYLQWTPWIAKLNLMDEIWVPTEIERINVFESGCTVPISVMLAATDIKKYNVSERKPNKEFTFYSIGDGERKNLDALIIAFHREFDRNEPVALTIKTNNGQFPEQVNNLKKILAIYTNFAQYKQEKFIICSR